jgi:spore germination cell wall hydrolase CwlJ-like protein
MQQRLVTLNSRARAGVRAIGDIRVATVARLLLLLVPVLLGSAIARTDQTQSADLKHQGRFTDVPGPAGFLGVPPKPEPLTFETLAPGDARLANLRTPFAPGVGAAAPAFFFGGSVVSRMRAVDCLASAMWYEAGNGDLGQRAVAQVVLNRVRHPAFPSTVCGVVFQGAERKTGCQFTFTCDGALHRRPSPRDLALARMRAEVMLNGGVVPQVGLATHYHTDWVHPVWSSAMDKLTSVDTHLFFRWAGAWGKPAAFRQHYSQNEPAIGLLAVISEAHNSLTDPETLLPRAIEDGALEAGGAPDAVPAPPAGAAGQGQPRPGQPITIWMMPGGDGGRQSYQALGRCTGQIACKVFGYVDGRPDKLAFLYVRDRRAGWTEIMLWDCTVFPRAKSGECLSPASQKSIDYAI